jgi:hypothetical protein
MMMKRMAFSVRSFALLSLVLPLACSLSPPVHRAGVDGSAPGRDDATAAGGALGGIDGLGEAAGRPGDDQLDDLLDDLLFVPQGLSNTNVDGQDEGLTLVAFTLMQEPTGPKLYAAVRNDGDTPACAAGMTTDFRDKAGQVVTSSGAVLQSGRLYRMTDGTILACVAPGQVAMAASTDLPTSMVIDQLGSLQHLFPSFTLPGVVPISGLSVSDVQPVVTDAGDAYTGKVTSALDVSVSNPRVTIFPVNRVGRPLGAATATSSTSDLPPGGSWTFTTSAVNTLGVDYVAYPAASLPD